jgi:TolB-like protein
MTKHTRLLAILAVLAACVSAARAQPQTQPAGDRADRGLTVAILDFETKDPSNPDLGKQIADTLTALLSGEPGLTLVERGRLNEVLEEQSLNLTGLVDTKQAVSVGQLVGARIIITGRAFPLGQKIFVTAKLIGTETSLVDGALVKSEQSTPMDEVVIELSQEVTKRLREQGPKLVAGPDPVDPVPALKERLAKKKLPKIAVVIPESHMAARPETPANPPDPAVETEIKHVLTRAGVTVVDVKDNALADWARAWTPEHAGNWPRSLAAADVVIAGEGLSEFGARLGNLVSCAARAEINLIDRDTGKILVAERETTRAVDLQEHIAAKKALQKSGFVLGIRVLEYLAANAPDR